MIRAARLTAALLLATGACSTPPADPPEPTRSESSVPSPPDFGEGTAIIDKGEDSILVDVEIADLPEQRAYGLMYRRELPPDYGMMFLFFESVSSPFYMKNTYVPLSIAFFDERGTILDIQDMQPCTKDPCPLYAPKTEYRGALEVGAGAFDDWGVEVGDSIRLAR